MEEQISRLIVERFTQRWVKALAVDVAIVGAGPSGLVAARDLAQAGYRVAVFERRLAPGGGVWGGGMLYNEVIVQTEAAALLAEWGLRTTPTPEDTLHAIGAIELAAGLVLGAVQSGAEVFNNMSVEDLVLRAGRVAGVVVQWTPVERLQMHVDPLMVRARAVLDATGHPSEISARLARKAGVQLETATGGVVGERPLWSAAGEEDTVAKTGRVYPGLYVSGMAACNVQGGHRMGPVFGGMLRSGRKVAAQIATELQTG